MSKKDKKEVQILDDEKGLVLNHEYDGIKELNNPLPGWWTGIFVVTVIFSVIYFYYYHMMEGHSLQHEYQADLAKIVKEVKVESAGAVVGFTDEAFNAAMGNGSIMDVAKGVYQGKCAVCHGAEGQGGIGPNLTDKFWLNSDGSAKGIHDTISNGVLTKGMPAWKDILKADEVMALTVFVTKLKGTTPPNPKKPQGQEYP